MKISEVMEITMLTKKAINYYEEEGPCFSKTSRTGGYYWSGYSDRYNLRL